MTLLNLYLIVSSLCLFFISTAWSKNGWSNVAFKTLTGLSGFVGVLLVLKTFGLI